MILMAAERWDDIQAHVALLEGFELRLGDEIIDLPLGAQRLIAFLALHDRPLQRSFVANSLWLDSNEERASANLRSALWRLNRNSRPVVDVRGTQLGLRSDVTVDLRTATGRARQLLIEPALSDFDEPFEIATMGDVLPDWYEDWIIVERERFRQLRLHALESLCEQLSSVGRHAQAIEAALGAVAGEPLRESAHRALINAYLAEGNAGEAIRQYRLCERLLRDELGIEPSPQIRQLVEPILPRATEQPLTVG